MILHNFPPYIKKPSAFTFDEVDMSLATISFSVMLDAQVNPDFQLDWAVEFRGRMFTLQTLLPSGIKDNTTMRYKYDLIFKSEEVELLYYPFLNMVALDSGDKLPNQSTFAFQGNITEFIDRFNLNLQYYLGDKWEMVYVGDGDVSTTTKTVSVDNSSLWDMLSQLYDLYNIRWSIKGNRIEVGALAEEVEHIFEYGSDKGLYSIQRTNPNDEIYTRLIGQGGNRNMPLTYFKTDDPDTNNIIKSMHFTGIMPKGYRDYIRGWNAGVVKPTETVEYNQGARDKIDGKKMQPINYVERNVDKWGVRYGSIQSNPDIYPTIQGMERAGLGRVDEIVAVEAVTEDDPENENFSDYFNVWIKDIGFDLRDPKYWVTERMKMMFSDGMLAGEDYEFELVAEEMGDGSLKPYIYPDTSKSYNGVQSAWRIQLLKSDAELQASGRYLPNKMQNTKAGDHFFLINIALPHEYVLQAEQRVTNWLNEEIVKTSDEFPTYTIKPSAIFMERFAEASKMKTGAKIRIADDRLVGDTYLPIYIQSMRLDYRDGKALPNIELTVSDKVVATRNPIELLQSAVQTLSSGAYSTQQITELTKQFERFFLRKDMPDTAKRVISFLQGLNIGNFSSGFLGGGGTFRMKDGVSVLEVDQLLVRMRAEFFSVMIHHAKHIGGELVMSPAEMMCIKVEETPNFYRCYFDTDGGKVINLFTNKDFARCQIFTGATQKFYWRKVVAVGVDYIELSKTDMVAGSDIPEIGDNIFQLGSLDPERQSAMIFSTVGYDAPSFKQYKDIDSMSLEGKEYTVFSGKGNKIVGKTVFMSDGSDLDNWGNNITGDIQDAQSDANEANRKAQEAIDKGVDDMADINSKLALMQEQLDGQVSNWFYSHVPTLDNIPASEWITDAEKDNHIGDTFTNTEPAPAPDSGKSWRFVKEDDIYKWVQISDSDALLALQKAMEALTVADGKSTTFMVQPYGYDVGDMWVLGEARTVDGVSYKQGDLLTALIGRDVFKESDWVKRVRYAGQAEIDEAIIKATFWSINLSSSVIYKDAINASTNGTHSTVAVKGELHQGTDITSGGFITVTPNGGTEPTTATASPVTIAPTNTEGKTSYTVKLYDTASKTKLLDTQTIPVVFKGASGVNAINVTLSNEADVLPASPEGVVSSYVGSGTDIKVFEGVTQLAYGTGNGQFQVSATGVGITVGIASTVGDNRVYGNASNMTADNATITFTITGKTALGASFSFTKAQTFAKARTGQTGDTGIQGIKGDKGADGIVYYTWVRYADTPTSGISQFPAGKKYIGFAYNKITATESNTYSDYKWSLIQGEDGKDGQKGADGTQYYNWIKYADTPTSGMSDNPDGKAYLGIAVNKTTPTESTNYADYSWQLTKGTDGKSVSLVDVEYAVNTSSTTAPTTGWQTTAPTLADGQQLWTRTKTTYSSGNPTYTTPANITPKKGDTGSTGTGIESITEEYYLSTSKTTQTGGSWVTEPPTWEYGKYIWTRSKIVYKNPTSTAYTTAIVSSEWEAVDSIKVGGKNLLREQDIRFDFKYWGEDGESINVDFDNLKSILTTENNLMLITENNFLIEM